MLYQSESADNLKTFSHESVSEGALEYWWNEATKHTEYVSFSVPKEKILDCQAYFIFQATVTDNAVMSFQNIFADQERLQ